MTVLHHNNDQQVRASRAQDLQTAEGHILDVYNQNPAHRSSSGKGYIKVSIPLANGKGTVSLAEGADAVQPGSRLPDMRKINLIEGAVEDNSGALTDKIIFTKEADGDWTSSYQSVPGAHIAHGTLKDVGPADFEGTLENLNTLTQVQPNQPLPPTDYMER